MTTPYDPVEPEHVVALLIRQRDLYGALRGLAERQHDLISGDRPELLLNVLEQRRKLITALAETNEQLTPIRRAWDILYERFPLSVRQQVGRLLAEIEESYQAIQQTDEQDSRLLAARKQSVAQSLGGVSGGQAANAAYARQAHGGGAGTDASA